MTNFDLLRQKEARLKQIEAEIETLRVALRLLTEDGPSHLNTPPDRLAVAGSMSF